MRHDPCFELIIVCMGTEYGETDSRRRVCLGTNGVNSAGRGPEEHLQGKA
jgi:hypothetical protein